MSETVELRVLDVKLRKDLYPRIETSSVTVQNYAENIEVLPPIEVNQHNELIDGWHRWTAHKRKERNTIPAIVTQTESDADVLELAIERNAKFGIQLSRQDKQKIARTIYRGAKLEERGPKKQHLADILSVSYATIAKWISRIDKDEEEARNAAIQSLYLKCYTEHEIAEAVGVSRDVTHKVLCQIQEFEIPTIPGIFGEMLPEETATEKVRREAEDKRQAAITEHNQAKAEHAVDFKVPIFNVWKQQTKTEGLDHFGNSEVTWLDRLLYLYTDPFDIVVDPFAGSGSTLDASIDRFRRAWVSDRKVSEEKEGTVRELDVTEGLPDLRKRWSEVKLVYLDPPYWKQAEGQYSDDPTDLANMSLEQFHETLAKVIRDFSKKLNNAYIALIIQPTQWKAPDKQFTDHIGVMLNSVKLPVDMRYSVPYESQQCTPQMVDWAKENKRCLVLTREIIVWRIA